MNAGKLRSSVSEGDRLPIVVILHDHDAGRIQSLEAVAADAGAKIVIVDAATASTLQLSSAAYAGLVHLRPAAAADGGLAVIRALSKKGVRVIAYGDRLEDWPIGARCQAFLAGGTALLDSTQPQLIDRLWAAVLTTCNAEARLAREREEVRRTFQMHGIVGHSNAMEWIFRWTLRVSRLSDLHVLVTGETGTGKQLFAEAIHRLDPKRRSGPFVVVNCGAISPSLAESELFGYRRGAFTGADRERKGLVRAAHGGVLLLDEIGELAPAHQSKILRVLQHGRVLSLGDDHEVPVDVRVIAATNRNLEEMVARGTFRADLFHRLNVLSMHIPPLRDRRGDIQALVEHFAAAHAHLRARGPLTAGKDFVAALARANLPGNAREIENIVRHAIVHNEDGTSLTLADLPPGIWSQVSELESRVDPHAANAGRRMDPPDVDPAVASAYLWQVLSTNGWSLSRSLASCEQLIVASALRSADGNQSRAARLLGVTPRSVYNKLRKYQLTKHTA
jgi:transcriptional regulator with PAS, ATPase and Fis domain